MRIWRLLFLVSLAALPVQLGKYFFLNKESFVLGLPIDYLAIPLYFSDFTVILCLLAYFFEKRRELRKIYLTQRLFLFSGASFLMYITVSSILIKTITPTGIYFTLKFLMLMLYSLVASDFFSQPRHKNYAKIILYFSLFWQSALIILEFILQKSLNLWFLGERSFDVTTSNIAHLSLLGQQFLRPYGTFPHPNVAAAFLSVYLILYSHLPITKTLKIKKAEKVGYLLIISALALTFSKTAFLAVAVYFFAATKSIKSKLAVLTLGCLLAIGAIKFQQVLPVASIAERLLLAQTALRISTDNPFLGVGPTNFIRSLSVLNLYSLSQTRLLQPVHNIFLLLLTETGIIGLILFTLFLFSVLRRANDRKKQALFILVLIFGSFDHFLFTIHQGQLLLFLVLGFILSVPRRGSNRQA